MYALLFDYEQTDPNDFARHVTALPRKQVRWLAMHHPDNRIRKFLFRQTGVRVGSGAVLNIHLCILDNYEPLVEIGQRASVGPNVTIVANAGPNNSNLNLDQYVRDQLIGSYPVIIGDDAWIGAGAIILPNVTIGDAAIVGAGAVVTENVENHAIVAGVPARTIRKIV